MTPRISPDGHTLAFLAMERGLTQVAVMKPDTGNWTVLTHERNVGPATELNWSADGNTIYFDRQADVPLGGTFSSARCGAARNNVCSRMRINRNRAARRQPLGWCGSAPSSELRVYRFCSPNANG